MVIFRFLIHIVKKGYTYLHSMEISVRKTHHSSLCGLVLPGHHVSTLLREEHCSSVRNGAYSGFIHTYNQVRGQGAHLASELGNHGGGSGRR